MMVEVAPLLIRWSGIMVVKGSSVGLTLGVMFISPRFLGHLVS